MPYRGRGCRIFQFTPLREGRRSFGSSSSISEKFQFTPLREGRPKCFLVINYDKDISIHAPPRGATAYTNNVRLPRLLISIHAPPRGATARKSSALRRTKHFNSRPSARGDFSRCSASRPRKYFNSRPSARGDYRNYATQEVNLISIHAPPRGATNIRVFIEEGEPNFNSRPSARGDANIVRNIPTKEIFQFTPLREGRRQSRRLAYPTWIYFNSRPSARGDLTIDYVSGIIPISIHAPPRGATGGVLHNHQRQK